MYSGSLRRSAEGTVHRRERNRAGRRDQTTETDDVREVCQGVRERVLHHDTTAASQHCPHHWTVR